jgi:hypothetical protein
MPGQKVDPVRATKGKAQDDANIFKRFQYEYPRERQCSHFALLCPIQRTKAACRSPSRIPDTQNILGESIER